MLHSHTFLRSATNKILIHLPSVILLTSSLNAMVVALPLPSDAAVGPPGPTRYELVCSSPIATKTCSDAPYNYRCGLSNKPTMDEKLALCEPDPNNGQGGCTCKQAL